MKEMVFNLYDYDWNIKDNIILCFDFKNSLFNVEGKISRKVEEDSTYTYKILKTKIKAIWWIDWLYDFFEKANLPDSPFNSDTYYSIVKRGVLD